MVSGVVSEDRSIWLLMESLCWELQHEGKTDKEIERALRARFPESYDNYVIHEALCHAAMEACACAPNKEGETQVFCDRERCHSLKSKEQR